MLRVLPRHGVRRPGHPPLGEEQYHEKTADIGPYVPVPRAVPVSGGAGGGTTREVCLSKKLCFLTNERFRSIRSGPLILCAKGIRNWYDSFGTSRYSDAKKISFLPRSRLFLKLLSRLFFSFEKMARIYPDKAFVFVRFAKISFWLFCRLTGRPRNMYNRCYEIRVSLPIFE